MADDLVTFVIDGPAERNGNVTAETFLAKLRQFVATLYGLERAFTRHTQRQIELEVVDLSRASPARVHLRVRSKSAAYAAAPAVAWAFDQLRSIRESTAADESIPPAAIDNVIELAHHRRREVAEFSLLRAEYAGREVVFDQVMEASALAVRAAQKMSVSPAWHSGTTKGTIFGELRGVLDFDGERQFYIVPPSGPDRVPCVFPEGMRAAMNEHLFRVVRASGLLRYQPETPFPVLLEADTLEGITEQPTTTHLSQLGGLFAGLEPAEPLELD